MGKLAGAKPVAYLVSRFKIKLILMSLFLAKACAILAFGFSNSFILVLFSRFASGFFSNSQFAIRKLLLSIDFQLKELPGKSSKIALLAFKTGCAIAVILSGFLSNCGDFMPESSQFVQKKFLLISLLVFLLDLSGVLLVFSIETKEFVIVKVTSSYSELSESKENKEIESGITEKASKDKSDLANFFQSAVLANEHIPSEESVGPEEVKFYSPRKQSSKEFNTRNIHSARTKPESNFSFPDSVVETKSHERQEGEGKRTHISFIEDELEIIEETYKPESPRQSIVENKDKIEENLLGFSIKTRVLLTVGNTLIIETLPVSVYLTFNDHYYVVATVLCLVFCAGVGGYYLLSERIMEKYSVAIQMLRICLALFSLLAFFPVLVFLDVGILLVAIWTGLVFCAEALMCVGNIMIADSVMNAEREIVLEKINFWCILCKALVCIVATGLVGAVEWQAAFTLFSLIFGILFWVARNAQKLYPDICEVPYKL